MVQFALYIRYKKKNQCINKFIKFKQLSVGNSIEKYKNVLNSTKCFSTRFGINRIYDELQTKYDDNILESE